MNIQNKMFNWALKKLTVREYSELELFKQLQKKFECNDSKIIQEVINQLKDYNYISNERYTESRVKGLISKKYGPKMIKMKLFEKGIHSDLVETEISKHGQLIQMNLQKLISLKFKDSSFEEKNKLIHKLSNKGYDLDLIFAEIDKFLAKDIN